MVYQSVKTSGYERLNFRRNRKRTSGDTVYKKAHACHWLNEYYKSLHIIWTDGNLASFIKVVDPHEY